MRRARFSALAWALATLGCSTSSVYEVYVDAGPSDGDYQPPPTPTECTPRAEFAADCAAGFCAVPAGCFLMGSPLTDPCRDGDEAQRWVTLTRPFELSQTEVTQAEFASLMGYDPSSFTACGDSCPVDSVTWHEAAAYANLSSQAAGLAECYTCSGDAPDVSCRVADASAGSGTTLYDCPGYRLPTEAEFEYAYRAGTTTEFYVGPILACWEADANADAIGWYKQNSDANAHPTSLKQPNVLGLYDMGGNVEEWTADGYATYADDPVQDPLSPVVSDDHHTARGGSWRVYAKDLRASDRNDFAGSVRTAYRGFRLARTR
jgi:formylglycine-generating enzyme required for sulfatase activity